MSRIESIQGYRAFLFMNIFLFHILGLVGVRENFMNGFFMGSGRFGVTGFMLLTGALSTYIKKNTLSNSISNNIKNKIRLFFKKYYLWHIVFTMLALPFSIWALHLNQKTLTRFLLELFSSITLTQSMIPIENLATSLNDVAWYLSTYVFLLPIIVLVASRINNRSKKGNGKLVLLMLITIYGIYILFAALIAAVNTGDFIKCWLLYYFFGIRAFEILIGALMGRLLSNQNLRFGPSVFLVSVLLYIGVQCFFGTIPAWLSYSLAYIPVNCLLVSTCFNGSTFMRALWSNRMLTYVGNRSMYYYLCHVVLGKYMLRILDKTGFLKFLNNNLQNILSVVICFTATLIVGEIMIKVTEYYNHKLNSKRQSE
jgi:peptidoglycan/LPS O-acetylase OafA/YrhL